MEDTAKSLPESPPKKSFGQLVDKYLIPPRGFIPDFLAYAREITDASDRLLIPVAITLAGHALARNVYSLKGAMHLNTYQILVGPSGCRKTTAIEIGLDLLREAMPGTLLADEFTTERLIGLFKQEPKRLWACPEFSGTLEHMDRDYMKGLKPLLSRLYDNPPSYDRELQKGGVEAHNPCLSLLLASQSDWWVSMLHEIDALGGWLPRVAICPAGPYQRDYPFRNEPNKALRGALIGQLKVLAGKKDQINLTQEAESEWSSRRGIHYDILQETGNSEALRPFFIRLEEYAWKVGIIYAVTRTGGLMVEALDIERAFEWMNLIREATIDFVGGLAYGRDEKDLAKVWRLIKDNPPEITRTDLSNRAKVGLKDRLDKILETLEDREQIELIEVRTRPGGRSLKTYRAREKAEETESN